MAYILRREEQYSVAERANIVATLVGSGYQPCKTDSPREVFIRDRSTITLGKKVLQLSFSPDEGSDKEHLELLQGLQRITGVFNIGVDAKIELRQLSVAGLRAHFVPKQ